MFCYHCQEAKKNQVCDKTGICGKKENVSSLQDLLMYSLKGLAFYTTRADEFDLVSDKTHRFIANALFSMVTNVNFTPADFVALIDETLKRRDTIRQQFLAAYQQNHLTEFDQPIPEPANWQPDCLDEQALTDYGATVGVEQTLTLLDPDIHALQECLLYAVKGLGSLAVHRRAIADQSIEQDRFIQQALDFTLNQDNTLEQVLTWVLKAGTLGLSAMTALSQANSQRFGEPEPSTVYLDTWDRPGILVSGHDLSDIEDLLVQTQGTGIDIYTHGEAIVAHSYPQLKKYFNLVANYGNAWQNQKTEFPKFNGPILITTNSIQQPKKTYQEKLFTTGMVSWPEIPHIADRKPGQRKDFSALIAIAQNSPPPTPLTEGQYSLGYGNQTLSALIDQIALAIQSGQIQQIRVIVGTDGRHKERRYYTQLAENLPADCLILTAGDVKYRFYQHDFGKIGTLPRLLDVGQSQDFAVIIQGLTQLQKALGIESLNQLPVWFDIAWYEQKTLLIILALFALNFKNICIGPTLPPFFTPNLLTLLQQRFALQGIDHSTES